MIIIKMTEAHPKVISKTFMPGEVIFRENEHSQEMYIIIAGRIRILKNKGPDKEISYWQSWMPALFSVKCPL